MTERCDYCGKFVDTEKPSVEKIEFEDFGPFFRHMACDLEAEQEALAKSLENEPEGGWPRGSEADRI